MRTAKAFTLIEVLVAIAIIAILTSMVFFGSRYAIAATRERQTRATMTLLNSMLKELNSKAGKGRIESLYRAEYASSGDAPQSLEAIDLVMDFDSDNSRNAVFSWDALRITQKVMGAMGGIPSNGPLLNGVSVDQKLKPAGTSPPSNSLTFTGTWGPKANFTPPILLDAWGNPIVYLPGDFTLRTDSSGNAVRMMPGFKNVRFATHGDTERHRMASTGFNEANNETSTPPRSGATGFFASAGPDGNFATGDDNLYSFEN